MKIIYPVSIFPSVSETFILQQIIALQNRGHEVRILAGGRSAETVIHDDVIKHDLLKNTVYLDERTRSHQAGIDAQWTRSLSADIIHAHFAAWQAEFAMELSKRMEIPFIFTPHAYDLFVYSSKEKLKVLAEAASRMIAVTDFNKKYMIEMIGEEYADKIDIVRYGIPINQYVPADKTSGHKINLLTVGRLVEKKGISYAVEAVSRLSDRSNLQYRIIGEGPLYSDLKALIRELNMEATVSLLGAQPQSVVIEEMRKADIFLLPSVTAKNGDKEGLPNVILEAQAMKLPVISSKHTGIPEAVLDGVTGLLVPEREIEGMTRSLENLIRSPSKRREMGEKGREHVVSNFNMDKEIIKLEEILQNLTEARKVIRPQHKKAGKTDSYHKINVLIVSHSSYLYGAEQSLLTLLKGLDRKRFEPVVLLPDDAGNLLNEICKLNLKLVIIQAPWWLGKESKLSVLEGTLEEIMAVPKIIDVIQEHEIDLVYTNTIVKISGAIAAKLAGIPHVWHIRELVQVQDFITPLGLQDTLKLVDYLSDRIITNSEATSKQFISMGLKDKIEVIYNGIDLSLFDQEPRSGGLRKELGLEPESPLIAVMGYLQRCKMQDIVIKAMDIVSRTHPNVKLLIIGQGDADYQVYLEQLIKFYNLGDYVVFLKFRQDIPQILQEIDLIVVPSVAESFGRTSLEAMAAGKPVVATRTGGSAEIVVDSLTGYLVPPGDHEKLADAIIKILSDRQAAEKMGHAGRERAASLFSVERYVSSIEGLLIKTWEAGNISKSDHWTEHIKYEDLLIHIFKILSPVTLLTLSYELLFEKVRQQKPMEAQIKQMDELIRQREVQIRQRDEQIKQMHEHIDQLQASLDQVRNTLAYKIYSKTIKPLKKKLRKK